MSDSSKKLPSGIQEKPDGTRFVGGTTRLDGTVRKVLKIRPGFIPIEDIPKYKPRIRQTAKNDSATRSTNEILKLSSESKPISTIKEKEEDAKQNSKSNIKSLMSNSIQIDELEASLENISISSNKYIPPWKRNKQTNK